MLGFISGISLGVLLGVILIIILIWGWKDYRKSTKKMRDKVLETRIAKNKTEDKVRICFDPFKGFHLNTEYDLLNFMTILGYKPYTTGTTFTDDDITLRFVTYKRG